ncbi:RING-H2 finger protein ATL22 [Quercus suber]|uniref:RING-H2 finger protein ATL22 n=1 Tax=Quercus suber TaxID=58331 RepID=UPI000CE20E15|nr:RING-H2 finger protein ATL22-like [Quercus suber]
MDISLRIVIPSLLLFVLFIVDLGEGHNSCPELRCKADGPPIRFPFRLSNDRQPDQHSGYPGFDLYCSHENHTVLELPASVKAFVNSIDYESQLISVTDSDDCFPQKILGLNLSSTRFQFRNYLSDFALFNCTPESNSEYGRRVDCLSSSRHPVYAFFSFANIEEFPTLILSCTKMYNVSSVPYDIWKNPLLELTWSEPKCRDCEVRGEKCRFKNNTKFFETECFNLSPCKYKDNKGIVFNPIFTFIIE